MNIKGVKFGNYHSWNDFSLILSEKTIEAAKPKTAQVEIPGADSVLDLTEYFGEVNYNNRKLTFVFSTIVPRSKFLNLFSEIQNAIHGKKMRIVLDDDPHFYYLGRITVSEWKADKNVGKLTIDCDCEPFKYKHYETIVTEEVNLKKEIILNNLRRRVSPVITITNTTQLEMQIRFNNATYTLSAGTWTIPEFYLTEGKNFITVTGNGTIEFKYQEGGL